MVLHGKGNKRQELDLRKIRSDDKEELTDGPN